MVQISFDLQEDEIPATRVQSEKIPHAFHYPSHFCWTMQIKYSMLSYLSVMMRADNDGQREAM